MKYPAGLLASLRECCGVVTADSELASAVGTAAWRNSHKSKIYVAITQRIQVIDTIDTQCNLILASYLM